ncbi:hypothetical protein CYMTET_44723 [Cymbomonas tetramitiformis]|uniref:RIB43A-like with coiled-coils protein 2 n=1 Tax=Cymbomonas tetramitiformis TaxID=36881 RepID=A0AAE0BZN4_9CHLO|nr:hypothetical protein CYMTET_44723 [Cymbomonas tetramitiformis]
MTTMVDIGTQGFTRTQRVDSASRLDRVLDAKTRTIGVDKGALAGQMAEKSMQLSADKSRDTAYDQMANYFDNKMLLLEQEKRNIQREINKDHVNHWQTVQPIHTRREWDLNDPDYKKKDYPARVGDDDPRLGVSAAQCFTGEDLSAGHRKKLQLMQQKSWCDQQNHEKSEKKRKEAADEAAYEALRRAQLDHQDAVANAEMDARRAHTKQTAVDNMCLANQKAHKAAADKHAENHANHTEQYNTFNSAFMTEHGITAQSVMSDTRKRMDHYKGMNAEEAGNVREFQAMQRDELAMKRQNEKAEQQAYDQYTENVRRQLCQTASQIEQFRQEQRKAVTEELQAQGAEKAARDTHLNKTLYTNVPKPDYFAQFGTNHR